MGQALARDLLPIAMPMLIELYHRLPPPLRSLAATLRGYQLRRWRYGPQTERQVEAALERETWSAEQWQHWTHERLLSLLRRAATRVPYYRELWKGRSGAEWEALERWPFLEKEALRSRARSLVADDCDVARMFHDHTSGTTGTPIDLWFTRETVRSWYALFEARCRRWYGVARGDRWGIVGGQLVVPVAAREPPFWVWNGGLNQLYLSAYHLAPDLIPHYLAAIARHRVTSLLGYPSALHALARGALEAGRHDVELRVVVTNAEPLFEHQRETIATAFHCPVREAYGMAEIAAAASECEAGKLHLWPEAGWLEVFDEGRPVPAGAAGEVVASGLTNFDMPLVRYRVGDRIRLATAEERCGCGRTLPLVAVVEGRRDDVLYTRDGRVIGRLDPVFKSSLPIREAQIIQEELEEIRVRYVPAPDFTTAAGEVIVARLRERLGAVRVILEPVAELPREAGGKLRAVVCKLTESERRKLQQTSGGRPTAPR